MLITATSELMQRVSAAIAEGKPMFVLDEQRRCIMSGCRERLDHGELLEHYLATSRLVDDDIYEGPFLRMGRAYCVRYMQVRDIYIGEILSANELSLLMDNTDGVSGPLSLYSSMEYDLSMIWRSKAALEQALGSVSKEVQDLFYQMERPLYRISANTRNLYEYFGMICNPPQRTAVDIVRLCEKVVGRCNECLLPVGRHIECHLPREDKIYVRSDIRHATAALVNAVQNALLYSPKSCVPVLELHCSGRMVSIRVENTNITFGREPEPDISFVRSGYGIPIMRRFVSHVKGELELSLEDAVASVTLHMPILTEEEISEYALEAVYIGAEYDAGVPDYITLQMIQVTDLFSDT